ncbi:MAG: hypothetical protein L6E13_06500 [Firmicutes bacterium]|nr:hypothetical protein [Bacillota bacterium]
MGGRADWDPRWLEAFCADLQEGARLSREEPPDPEAVAAFARLLAEADPPPVPPDLVPALVEALAPPEAGHAGAAGAAAAAEGTAGAAAVAAAASPPRPAPGLAALLRLLWAEARYLPLSFLAVEALLLAAAVLVNRYVAALLALPPGEPGAGAAWSHLLARSRDALVLVAPGLGAAVGLFTLLPSAQGVWADLEALSPFSRSARLLARAGVATVAALLGTGVAGLLSPHPPGAAAAPAALVLLARTAPLLLAVGWALVWALRLGTLGAVAASLLLWLGLGVLGARAPRWDLFAVPATLGEALPQAVALALSLALMVWAAGSGDPGIARSTAFQRAGGAGGRP